MISSSSVAVLILGVAMGLVLATVYNYNHGGVNSATYGTPMLKQASRAFRRGRDVAGEGMGQATTAETGGTSAPPFHPSFLFGEARNVSSGTVHEASTSKSRASLIDEYIPPALRHKYGDAELQFNVSRSMLRRSRPVAGNNERLHAYLRKLRAGRCTTVLVIGGSVSGGHHVRNKATNAYPPLFVEWLNARYPCLSREGTAAQEGGRHRFRDTPASSSQSHFSFLADPGRVGDFDLVLIELNVNDRFIAHLPHALEDKGEAGARKGEATAPSVAEQLWRHLSSPAMPAAVPDYMSLWYYEVMLRRLLKARTPDPPAIVTFNADYTGRTWAGPPWYGKCGPTSRC